ncbi:aldehyde dehydrogenase, mitochondrial precursor [Trypanosoma conorhini]|uniref:Aldehyde dehydrogenase, mitochondrial n=1 Tax=Trypanosoma conorhini TaxID=83891 RepID=A0A3R7S083_9TRYP|nr:aldehyde dehydrogenase, mitochondrial precursor [Trypanosoma conorhini]RNF18327.1 aldehyde dehydrogenase, mitochondrial precursor [Trypanosoma conorhini]
MLRATTRALCDRPPAVKRLQDKLLINGKFVPAVSGKTFDVVNPATEEVCARVAEADAPDVDLAVAAAREAFQHYRTTDGRYRRGLMLKLADAIHRHREELAAVETLDNGKPYGVALRLDLAQVEECFRYYAGWADKVCGQVLPTSGSNFSFTKREPVGVCGQVIPWNFPLLMAAWKLAPALAMGNTVVLKPAEQTPLTALRLGELAVEAGYPDGVLNILPGFGPTAGARLAMHDDVDKIAFTGSTVVGHQIMRMAADSNLKRVTLELGGKSPLIVCDDADLDAAATVASEGVYFNTGQVCTASSRVFVHEKVHDAFVAKLKVLAESRRVGPGDDPANNHGPLVSARQHERVLGYIEKGKVEGATVVTGGARCGDRGYFVQPTVFTAVADKMTIAREEIFGPVVCVMAFKTMDEAIERANATTYGLAAGVCTTDVEKVMHCASFLRAGTVWVNCWNCFDAAMPFGGFKRSGLGRELGEQSLQHYTETKSVHIALKGPLVKN